MSSGDLAKILLQLREESNYVNLNPSDSNLRNLMHKYDMLFLGQDFNCIYSPELAHSLNKCFNIPVTIDEINQLIPSVCNALGMKYETLIHLSDTSKPNPPIAGYQITL